MIKIGMKGYSEAIRQFDGKNIKTGKLRGMKKIGSSVKTLASKLIRDEYNIKKGDVDDKFTIIASDSGVTIICAKRPINLTYFGARQYGATKAGKRITTKRKGDEISKSVRGKAGSFGGVVVPITRRSTTLLPGAFMAKVKSGKKGAFNIGVFSRRSYPAKTQYQDNRNRRTTGRPYVKRVRAVTPKPRQAIINRAFVSVATLFAGKRVMPAIEQYVNTDGLRTLIHEITWSLKGKP